MHSTQVPQPVVVGGQRLSTDERFGGDRVKLDRLADQSVEQKPSGGRSAAVEAEGKFVEVIVEVGVGYRALMGAHETAFKGIRPEKHGCATNQHELPSGKSLLRARD
jgi:hypothetical protein